MIKQLIEVMQQAIELELMHTLDEINEGNVPKEEYIEEYHAKLVVMTALINEMARKWEEEP